MLGVQLNYIEDDQLTTWIVLVRKLENLRILNKAIVSINCNIATSCGKSKIMNNLLEKNIRAADGRYLSDNELQPLQDYFTTFAARMETYCLLGVHAEKLILQALEKVAQTDRATLQQHHHLCKRDITCVLQSAALAILKDDEAGFTEQLIMWMQNIMTALKKEAQSARAYRALQEVITANLPATNALLVNHYLERFIDALMTSGAH